MHTCTCMHAQTCTHVYAQSYIHIPSSFSNAAATTMYHTHRETYSLGNEKQELKPNQIKSIQSSSNLAEIFLLMMAHLYAMSDFGCCSEACLFFHVFLCSKMLPMKKCYAEYLYHAERT